MRHASLFSGIGGPEVAAAMMGWENVFHCEINDFGRKILEYWFPESDSYEDITKTDFTRYRGRIDVLTGGFPCQPFSYAGKRGGQADDRYLWPEMLRVIDEVRPTWVIGENVAGITTMVESCETVDMGSEASLFEEDNGVHRFRAEYAFTIERICRDLESKGYSVQPMLIPACAVGAPHRRDRVFIIAHNTDCCNDVRESGENESESGEEWVSERNSVWKPGESDNVRSETEETSSDTNCRIISEWMQKRICENQKEEKRRVDNRVARFGYNGRTTRMLPTERWEGFPFVSPVHRGNDGLPFDVDNLTISFAKWRNESLKAYGNAIVPQVMYRIFQCIEKI